MSRNTEDKYFGFCLVGCSKGLCSFICSPCVVHLMCNILQCILRNFHHKQEKAYSEDFQTKISLKISHSVWIERKNLHILIASLITSWNPKKRLATQAGFFFLISHIKLMTTRLLSEWKQQIHTYALTKENPVNTWKKQFPVRKATWETLVSELWQGSCVLLPQISPNTLTEKKNPRRLLSLFQLQERKQNEMDAVGSLMRQAQVSPAQCEEFGRWKQMWSERRSGVGIKAPVSPEEVGALKEEVSAWRKGWV